MFISKKTITKIAALLACMMLSALSVKAAESASSHVSGKNEVSYENKYFKFRVNKGIKVSEDRGVYTANCIEITMPVEWKKFSRYHVIAMHEEVADRLAANPPKDFSQQELIANGTQVGPYGKPDPNTIKPGKLTGGEAFFKFKADFILGDIGYGFAFQEALIRTNDDKFILLKFPESSNCSIKRDQRQMDLMLSTLEIKYSKILAVQASTGTTQSAKTDILNQVGKRAFKNS